MAVTREPLVELASETLARVPRRVAHNDAALTNMLFVQDDAACLVDLDTLMPTAWFWDVGDLVRTAATAQAEDDPSAGVDRDLYAAIHEGYRSTAPQMTRAEIEALDVAGPIVTYEQALRFLTDWLEGDAYYRVVRPDQNLDRAHAQLGLVASLLDTVGDR
jgi:thiamine kinase-like enzyme